jgi:hypothetical protein
MRRVFPFCFDKSHFLNPESLTFFFGVGGLNQNQKNLFKILKANYQLECGFGFILAEGQMYEIPFTPVR